ncbi:MAG: CPBP family glutamic-type intramembrane protease [Bacteroidota bacterium]
MHYRIVLFLFSIFPTFSIAQEEFKFGALDSHKTFIKKLENVKDLDFERILTLYDDYIQKHPEDVIARVERCKFIGNAYYDEYEDYNLKFDETEACIESLYEEFPDEPASIVYKAQNEYGNERYQLLLKALESMENRPISWSNIEKASVHKMLGDWYEENNELALKSYRRAQTYDSNGDYSVQIARILIELEEKEEAAAILQVNIDKDTAYWSLYPKAHLLMEAGEPQMALEIFEEIAKKDSSYVSNQDLAEIMISIENYVAAREYYVRDTVISGWSDVSGVKNLFEHDLQYSKPQVALESYRSLQESNPFQDVLAIKRFKIFLKAPFLNWTFGESFRFGLNFLIVVLLFFLPYLWVLPVHYLSQVRRSKKRANQKSKLNLSWGLRHFWMISFVYLLVQFLLNTFFYYDYFIDTVFGDSYLIDDLFESEELLANGILVFVVLMTLGTLGFLNKKTLIQIWSSSISLGKSLGIALALFALNLVMMRITNTIFPFEELDLSELILNPRVEIVATLKTYGLLITLLCVGLLAPIYEEVVFRGIVLGSVEKRLGFVFANILQASLFALIHFSLQLFIYYFIFGYLTGVLVKRTGGLRTGILAHILNNTLATLALYGLLSM